MNWSESLEIEEEQWASNVGAIECKRCGKYFIPIHENSWRNECLDCSPATLKELRK